MKIHLASAYHILAGGGSTKINIGKKKEWCLQNMTILICYRYNLPLQ